MTLVGVNPDEMVHLLHSLFSFQVEFYLTSQRLFACWGELPTEGLPLVVEINHEAFAERRSICTVPRVDHVMRLGGISPTN